MFILSVSPYAFKEAQAQFSFLVIMGVEGVNELKY